MDCEETMGKRITLKRKRPNPLFQDWLEELYEEAKSKLSKLEFMLNAALDSLSKYPLPLQSGADCLILKGFDRKLCTFLDKRLEVYNSNKTLEQQASSATKPQSPSKCIESSPIEPDSSPEVSSPKDSGNIDHLPTNYANTETNSHETKKRKRTPKTRKTYKPVFRSGSYAILIALLEYSKEGLNNALKKDELIDRAQKHSEESFIRPKPDTFYTAWSSMSTLVKKGLVTQNKGKKAQYSLSDQGVLLAEELLEESKNIPTTNDLIFNDASNSNVVEPVVKKNGSRETEMIEIEDDVANVQRTVSEIVLTQMQPGSFDIVLLIDKNETSGVSKKNDPTVAQFNKYPDLKHEYRSLKVGDFTWIARNKTNREELVLPYIVERKRMDDLGASIKDGRFHEQKFRLRKCGLKNVIYLVENFGSNSHVGLPIQSLKQALANTRVQDGFKVHMTDSLSNSARFLAMMTKRLTIEYKDKHLLGYNRESQGEELMTFNYFNKASSKNKPLTVTETFIKLLLQLKGVSVEKALAITEAYKTPRLLMKEYEKCSKKEGEMLLANLKRGDLNRNVGPSTSKSIYQFFVWDL